MTSDGGASWTDLNESVPGGDLQGLALDPEGKTLYAATSGGGVLALHKTQLELFRSTMRGNHRMPI